MSAARENYVQPFARGNPRKLFTTKSPTGDAGTPRAARVAAARLTVPAGAADPKATPPCGEAGGVWGRMEGVGISYFGRPAGDGRRNRREECRPCRKRQTEAFFFPTPGSEISKFNLLITRTLVT